MASAFVGLLDSPNRVILEHEPVKIISYGGVAMPDDLVAEVVEAADIVVPPRKSVDSSAS